MMFRQEELTFTEAADYKEVAELRLEALIQDLPLPPRTRSEVLEAAMDYAKSCATLAALGETLP